MTRRASVAAAPGLRLFPGYFDRAAQQFLLAEIQDLLAQAPLYTPTMPGSGKPCSVRMSNCGTLGWVSDRRGYRYQSTHPVTGAPWPPIPDLLLRTWSELSGYPAPPEACLVNYYEPSARMGLHQDRDEEDFAAPIVSVSLGTTCRFRFGGTARAAPTRSFLLASGDVLTMGGASRLAFHGVDRLLAGPSALAGEGYRINLTLRRVTKGPRENN